MLQWGFTATAEALACYRAATAVLLSCSLVMLWRLPQAAASGGLQASTLLGLQAQAVQVCIQLATRCCRLVCCQRRHKGHLRTQGGCSLGGLGLGEAGVG